MALFTHLYGSFTLPSPSTTSTLLSTTLLQTPRGDFVFLLHGALKPSPPLRLSASKWSLFYADLPPSSDSSFAFPNPHPFAPTADACDTFFEAPVFVINLLTWQVGHLLVDVLEPLFHHLFDGTNVDTNNHIFLNVASADEAAILHELILQEVYERGTAFELLKRFTDNPIHPAATLYTLPGKTCFTEIVLELDAARTYHTKGQATGGAFIGSSDVELKQDYASFQGWLLAQLPVPAQTSASQQVLFIERSHKRRLLNLAQLVAVAKSAAAAHALTFRLTSLESHPFPQQLLAFRNTRVLISQYGSGGHNVLFLPSGGVLLLLLQPGWCDQAWTYANQAVLSGGSVVCVCGGEGETVRFRWTHMGWEGGPWATKDEDWAVGEEVMGKAVGRALELASEEGGKGVVEVMYDVSHDVSEEDSSLPNVRVHFSDWEVAAGGGGVELILEVVARKSTVVAGGELRRLLEAGGLELCVEVVEVAGKGERVCMKSSELSEFGVFALQVEGEVTLKGWLEGVEESESYFWIGGEGKRGEEGAADLVHPTALQGQIALECRERQMAESECSALARRTYKAVLS